MIQAGDDEELAAPIFCTDGSLLSRIIGAEQQRLQRLVPGYPPETLIAFEVSF